MATRTSRTILTTILLLLIAVLVLQALAYGVTFAVDPEGGVAEFGPDAPTRPDDVTVALVGLLGLAMIGVAALLGLSALLIVRSRPAGTGIAMIIGAFYVLAGLNAFRAEWLWDTGFYLITGIALIVLAAAVRRMHPGREDAAARSE